MKMNDDKTTHNREYLTVLLRRRSVVAFCCGILTLAVAFGVSAAIAGISNFLTKKRTKKMYLYWSDDLGPIEVRIEAFGMGRMAGECSKKNNIQIPYDILAVLAEKYNMETEDLIKPFVKGLMIELNEQQI